MAPGDANTISLTAGLDPGAEPVAVPRVLGPYEFVRQLGVGGMGEVWLARDTVLARSVAIKFVIASRSEDLAAHAALLEGVRAVCAIRHENLVAVHAADVHDGVPYIVMEYVDGPDLRSALRGAGPVPPGLAAGCVRRIAAAVGELHRAGIVHRDIKPANVMLAGDGRLLVTDFGLSCQRPVTSVRGERAFVAGSPAYMAPEAFEGEVSPRTDVYALGVMLVEMLLGEQPFAGDLEEIERLHRRGVFPTERIEAIDPALADVVGRCLRTNLVYRYKDASHLAEALRQARPADADADPAPRLLRLARGEKLIDAAERTPSRDYYGTLSALAKGRDRTPAPDAASLGKARAEQADRVEDVVVTDALPCAACGYELKGMRTTAGCPECGAAVAESAGPATLQATDDAGVQRLAAIAIAAAYAGGAPLLAVALLTLGSAATALLLEFAVPPSAVPQVERIAAAVGTVIAMMAMLAALAGTGVLSRARMGAAGARAPVTAYALAVGIAATIGAAATVAACVAAVMIGDNHSLGLDAIAVAAFAAALAATARGIKKNTGLGWAPRLRQAASKAWWAAAATAVLAPAGISLIWVKRLAEPRTADFDTPLSAAALISEGLLAISGLLVLPILAVIMSARLHGHAKAILRARGAAAPSPGVIPGLRAR